MISGIKGSASDQTDQRDEDRQRTPNPNEDGAAAKALAKHQPTGIEILHLDFARDFFQPGSGFLDLDPLHAQFEQFLHGDGAAAIGHGDYYAMDLLLVNNVHQVRGHRTRG